MKTLAVSIDLLTKEMDLSEISRILGVPSSNSSHNKGDRRPIDRVWEMAVWRYESGLEETRPLDEHVEHLLRTVVPAIIREGANLPADRTVLLNIGVFFRTPAAGVAISADHLKRLGDANIGLDLTTYPCSD